MKSPLTRVSREVRDMLSEFIDDHGMKIEYTGGGHIRILSRDGKIVTHVSKTASDHRAAMNARSHIRQFLRRQA